MKKTLLAILAASTLSGCFDDNNAVEKGMSQQYSDLSAAHLENDMKTRAIAAHYQANAKNNLVTEVNGYFNIKNIMSTLTALEGLSTDTKAALAASSELQITKKMATADDGDSGTDNDAQSSVSTMDFIDLIFAKQNFSGTTNSDTDDDAESKRVGPYQTQVSQAQANRFNSSVCHLVFGTKDNQAGKEIELSIDKKLIADADAKKILAAMEDHFYSCAKDPADQSKLMTTGRVMVELGSNTKYEFLVNQNSREIYVNNGEDEISVMIDGKEVKAETGIYFSGAQNANQTKLEKLESEKAEQEAKKLIAAHKVAAVATARDNYLESQTITQEIANIKEAYKTYTDSTKTDEDAATLRDILIANVTYSGVQLAGDANKATTEAAYMPLLLALSEAKAAITGISAENADFKAFTAVNGAKTTFGLGDNTPNNDDNTTLATELTKHTASTGVALTATPTDAQSISDANKILIALADKIDSNTPSKATYDAEVAKIAGDNKTAYDAADKLITRLGYRIEAVEADIAVDAAKAAETASTDTAQADTLKKAVTDAEATAKTKAEVVAKLDAVEKAEAADKKTSTTATKSAVTKATKALTDLIAKNDKAEADANAAA
jgi:hypothetical protein